MLESIRINFIIVNYQMIRKSIDFKGGSAYCQQFVV